MPVAVKKAQKPPKSTPRAGADLQLRLRRPGHAKDRIANFEALEKKAPKKLKLQLKRARAAAKKKGAKFTPVITSVSGKNHAELTGLKLPANLAEVIKKKNAKTKNKIGTLRLPGMESATRSRQITMPTPMKKHIFRPPPPPAAPGAPSAPGAPGDNAPRSAGPSSQGLPYGTNTSNFCDMGTAEFTWIDYIRSSSVARSSSSHSVLLH